MKKIDNFFCDFNQALALNKFGFNDPCFGGFDYDNNFLYHPDSDIILDSPIKSQALMWFDDNTPLNGFVVNGIKDGYFDWLILNIDTDERFECDEAYSNRLEAEKALIDKLIKIYETIK